MSGQPRHAKASVLPVGGETVIPAQAGIHRSKTRAVEKWIPAFAGMTENDCKPGSALTLLSAAEEGRAAGLNDPADSFRAIAAGARLALAAVDRPAMLEIADFAVRLDIVAQ